ncbi:MAG: hypothetical protein ABJM06_06355 [Gilvibacter sp.]
MKSLLEYLGDNYIGIVVFIIIIFSIIGALNWMARIFRWGRYKTESQESDHLNGITYVISVFFTNLINDFKHLLALIIVIIFTGLIIYSMAAGSNFDEKLEALQLVIASLGGLLGSIIGYYFGESAARGASPTVLTYGEASQGGDDFEPVETDIEAAPDLNLGEVEH